MKIVKVNPTALRYAGVDDEANHEEYAIRFFSWRHFSFRYVSIMQYGTFRHSSAQDTHKGVHTHSDLGYVAWTLEFTQRRYGLSARLKGAWPRIIMRIKYFFSLRRYGKSVGSDQAQKALMMWKLKGESEEKQSQSPF